MSRTERLLALIQSLRLHRRPVRGASLAEEMSVSLRTVYRDTQTCIPLVQIASDTQTLLFYRNHCYLAPTWRDHVYLCRAGLMYDPVKRGGEHG
jgi:predicted DNA-binding transcriptional regulator YafY